MSVSELLMRYRKKQDFVETTLLELAWDRMQRTPVYWLRGGRYIDSMNLIQGL